MKLRVENYLSGNHKQATTPCLSVYWSKDTGCIFPDSLRRGAAAMVGMGGIT